MTIDPQQLDEEGSAAAPKNRNRLDFLRFTGAAVVGGGCEVLTFGAVSAVMSGTIVAVPVARWDLPNTIGAALLAAVAELAGVRTSTEP